MPPSYLTARGIKHAINGEDLTFYPLSVQQLLKLKELARPVGQALAALFSNLGGNEADRGRASRFWKGRDAKPIRDEKGKLTGLWEGEGGSEDTPVLPSLEVVRFRSGERDQAVQAITDALLDRKNLEAVATLVCDSLREEKLKTEDVMAADLPTLWQLLRGVAKANTKDLPPLPTWVRTKLDGLTPKDESGSSSSATPTGTAG